MYADVARGGRVAVDDQGLIDVTRTGSAIAPYRGNIIGQSSRPDLPTEDGRPFAELRKTISDTFRIISVHRWAFLVPFSLVSSAAFLLSLYYPRTYQATTTFERRNDPIMIDLPSAAGAASFRYFRSTMERDLTSLAYMSEAVENLGLLSDLSRQPDGTLTPEAERKRSSLARELGGTIAINTMSPNEHVDIIKLTYTGPDPRIGTKLLDEVKKTYTRRTMAWIRRFLESQRDYFAQSLIEAGDVVKLALHDQTRLRMESPHFNPEDPGEVTVRIGAYELERRELELRRRDYDAELQSLRQMIAMTQPAEVTAQGVDELGDAIRMYSSPETLHAVDQIQRIDVEIDKLRTTRGVTDEHPEMKHLSAQRRVADAELQRTRERDREAASQPHHGVGPGLAIAHPLLGERARLAIQMATQEARIRDMDITIGTNEAAIEQLRTAKAGIFGHLDEYSDITANVSKARQRHREISETLSKIEPAIKAIEQDRVLQFTAGEPARGSIIPVNPKSTTIMLLAILSGLGAGVVFVMLAEILDSVYHNSTQIARSLGLPILETIDVIVTSGDRRRLLVQQAVFAPLLLVAFLSLTGFSVAAFPSIERPWTFQEIRALPQSAMKLFASKDTPVAESTKVIPG